MGKTSLALNIAEHVAIEKQQGTVAIFSMEMPAEQIISRLFSSVAKINQMHMRSGKLTDTEWTKLVKWLSIFKKASLYIDDSSALTDIDVCARVRRLKRDQPDLALVIVDYLQLMHLDRTIENRAVENLWYFSCLKGRSPARSTCRWLPYRNSIAISKAVEPNLKCPIYENPEL